MTKSLKTTILSLVIATCVTALSSAKGSRIFESEWAETAPTHVKLFDSAVRADISQGKVLVDSQIGLESADIARGKKLVNSLLLDEISDSDSQFGSGSGIFNSVILEKEAAKETTSATVEQEVDPAIVDQEAVPLKVKQEADPSYLWTIGGYLYSPIGYTLGGVNDFARGWDASFLMTYITIGLMEETVTNLAYSTAIGFSLLSGGSSYAATYSGYKAYLAAKAFFKMPGLQFMASYYTAGRVQSAVNYTLDLAVIAAEEAAIRSISTARSFGSYMWSNWSYN
jgi:hypothetical protein